MAHDKRKPSDLGINTRLAHCGYDPSDYHGFVNPPVVHASTVLFPNAAAMTARTQKYTYGTHGTTTTDALCAAIDELEGSAATILSLPASRPSRCRFWRFLRLETMR